MHYGLDHLFVIECTFYTRPTMCLHCICFMHIRSLCWFSAVCECCEGVRTPPQHPVQSGIAKRETSTWETPSSRGRNGGFSGAMDSDPSWNNKHCFFQLQKWLRQIFARLCKVTLHRHFCFPGDIYILDSANALMRILRQPRLLHAFLHCCSQQSVYTGFALFSHEYKLQCDGQA